MVITQSNYTVQSFDQTLEAIEFSLDSGMEPWIIVTKENDNQNNVLEVPLKTISSKLFIKSKGKPQFPFKIQ